MLAAEHQDVSQIRSNTKETKRPCMATKVSQEQIENAFLPAREITDPERFAGRKAQVEQCYLGLMADGSNLALLGNRGVGKSSLARQLALLATGHNDLLERYEVPHDRKLDFLTLSYTCGNTIRSTDHLLERLLSSADCLSPWLYDVPQAKKILEAYNPKFEASVLGIGVGLGGTKSTEVTSEKPGPDHDTASVFTNVVSLLSKQQPARDGILLIVDEFDQIADKTGFASFLKALATNVPKLKFAIVGVAHDLYDLMKEHQSSDRLFAGGVVPVPAMNAQELGEIIGIAETQIENAIRFDKGARDRLVSLAQGHPYMLHLLGKHSFRSAWRQGRDLIRADDVSSTLRTIAESGADPVLEGRYKKAIQSSPHREAVLRALAFSEKNGEVWTTDAYPIATKAGVENPSQYVGNLVIDEYGAELIKVRDRYYRFKDSLFRAYVCARPQQYSPSEVTG
jgi:Cdc6-like AAA superfamily ATPase